MRKRKAASWARGVALAAVTITTACGGGGGPNPTTPRPTAVLVLSASPSPVVGDLCGSHCGDLAGEREALTSLTIRETAGVAVNVTGGTQELRNNATGAVIAMSMLTPSDFVRDPGMARIAASFTFVIQAVDDNGHAVSVTLAVPTTG